MISPYTTFDGAVKSEGQGLLADGVLVQVFAVR